MHSKSLAPSLQGAAVWWELGKGRGGAGENREVEEHPSLWHAAPFSEGVPGSQPVALLR